MSVVLADSIFSEKDNYLVVLHDLLPVLCETFSVKYFYHHHFFKTIEYVVVRRPYLSHAFLSRRSSFIVVAVGVGEEVKWKMKRLRP